MKRTKCFDGSKFIPAHVGVYGVIYEDCNKLRIGYKYWNGIFWCHSCNYPEAAYEYRIYPSLDQNSDWSGLEDKP